MITKMILPTDAFLGCSAGVVLLGCDTASIGVDATESLGCGVGSAGAGPFGGSVVGSGCLLSGSIILLVNIHKAGRLRLAAYSAV